MNAEPPAEVLDEDAFNEDVFDEQMNVVGIMMSNDDWIPGEAMVDINGRTIGIMTQIRPVIHLVNEEQVEIIQANLYICVLFQMNLSRE